jgi:hypothetical protein
MGLWPLSVLPLTPLLPRGAGSPLCSDRMGVGFFLLRLQLPPLAKFYSARLPLPSPAYRCWSAWKATFPLWHISEVSVGCPDRCLPSNRKPLDSVSFHHTWDDNLFDSGCPLKDRNPARIGLLRSKGGERHLCRWRGSNPTRLHPLSGEPSTMTPAVVQPVRRLPPINNAQLRHA